MIYYRIWIWFCTMVQASKASSSPRWRLAPTRREQEKWERARNASTGGTVSQISKFSFLLKMCLTSFNRTAQVFYMLKCLSYMLVADVGTCLNCFKFQWVLVHACKSSVISFLFAFVPLWLVHINLTMCMWHVMPEQCSPFVARLNWKSDSILCLFRM